MIINSLKFGEIEIDDSTIITFPEGLPGFETTKRFAVVNCEYTDPIQWLHSVDDSSAVLPVVNPYLLVQGYDVEVDDTDLEIIGTKREEDIILLNVMVLPEELSNMTINLMAPILINVRKLLGKQIFMDHKDIPIKKPVFKELMNYYLAEEARAIAGTDEKTQ